MSKTTLDLSTLSGISDGTHTVKVKAKADGYRGSEFSNEVSWTKAASSFSGSITCTSDNGYNIFNGSDGKWGLRELEVYSTHEVEGYSEYRVTTVSTFSNFTVLSNTNCSYVVENGGWNITPVDNNFTFVFSYIG